MSKNGPPWPGLQIYLPISVLLNGEWRTAGQCSVDSVRPPFEVGVTIVSIHQRARPGTNCVGHDSSFSAKEQHRNEHEHGRPEKAIAVGAGRLQRVVIHWDQTSRSLVRNDSRLGFCIRQVPLRYRVYTTN